MKNKFNTQDLSKAFDLINKSNQITLLTHYNPDGDCMSAAAALEEFLNQYQNKKIETIYPNNPKYEIKIQAKNRLIAKHTQTPDLLIMLDTAGYDRLYYPQEFSKIPSINIDHHVSNSIKADFNFINPNASSACEVLFDLLKQWDKSKITKEISESLLRGLLYDSNIFRTNSTNTNTLNAASELINLGADFSKIKAEMLANKTPNVIAFWGELLKNMQTTKNNTAVFCIATQNDLKKHSLNSSTLSEFSNFLSELVNTDISILFNETEDGKTKVSLRSKKTDVNLLAQNFGGGGHKNASGILTDEPIKIIVDKIINLIEK